MDPESDPFDGTWADDPLSQDSWQVQDEWAQEPLAQPEDDHSASPFSVAVAAVAGSAAIRGLRDRLRRGRREPEAVASAPAAPTVPAAVLPTVATSPVVDDSAVAERAALIALCVDLDDVLANEAHRQKLRRGLRDVGVDVVDPLNERFDPELHCAVGTEPAPAPADDRRIARVERVGFLDHGNEVRLPEVIVFRADGSASGA